MTHIVKTPLVLAKVQDGSNVYLYKGSPIPSNIADGEIERLLEGEFIEKVTLEDGDEKPARRTRSKADDAE